MQLFKQNKSLVNNHNHNHDNHDDDDNDNDNFSVDIFIYFNFLLYAHPRLKNIENYFRPTQE